MWSRTPSLPSLSPSEPSPHSRQTRYYKPPLGSLYTPQAPLQPHVFGRIEYKFLILTFKALPDLIPQFTNFCFPMVTTSHPLPLVQHVTLVYTAYELHNSRGTTHTVVTNCTAYMEALHVPHVQVQPLSTHYSTLYLPAIILFPCIYP